MRSPILSSLMLTLMLCLPAAVHAQDDDVEHPLLIVSGQAEVSVKPDQAIVRLGAVAQAETAAEAQNDVNKVMQQAIEAIKDLGIADQKLSTAGISLSPVYSQPRPPRPLPRDGRERQDVDEPFEPRIVAYRAHNTLRIEVDDLTKVGPVIDSGVKTGANNIEGVAFGLKNDKDARSRALQNAAKEAQDKAQALAKAMDIDLGPIWRIEEQHVEVRPVGFDRGMRMMAMEAAATPVQPGQVDVTASIRVQYRLDE